MKKETKKILRLIALFSPFLIFLFFLILIGGVLGGSLSEEIEKNGEKINRLTCGAYSVLATALTDENATGYTFLGEVKIEHRGNFKADSLILSVKVKANTRFVFYLVEGNERERIALQDAAYNGNERTNFMFKISKELNEENYIAIKATTKSEETDEEKDIDWDIYTIAFITGGN